MNSNVLKALINISKLKDFQISQIYHHSEGGNRITNKGDRLEYFIKDAFCGCINEKDRNKVNNIIYPQHLSYLGSQTKIPDVIIKKGDAIEIKKTSHSETQLNSSFPKRSLKKTDNITEECKNCEDDIGGWTIKDMQYVFGNINDTNLKINTLWFLHAKTMIADESLYENIFEELQGSLRQTHFNNSDTDELARFNNIDPLKITSLRVRGMWLLNHPVTVFNYISTVMKIHQEAISSRSSNKKKKYVIAIMLKDKYLSFDKKDQKEVEKLCIKEEIKIKNPNNPAKSVDAILVYKQFSD